MLRFSPAILTIPTAMTLVSNASYVNLGEQDNLYLSLAECNTGWVKYGDFCLGFSDEALNWYQALGVCNYYGARLVQIESQRKHDWIVSQLETRGIGDAWTAGSIRISGIWEWIPTFKRINNYENWAPNEPNNPAREKCLDLQANVGHKWNDESCFTSIYFICEKFIHI